VYYLLSFFAGALITAMVTSNGALASHYGIYTGVVLVHIIGLTASSLIMLLRRQSPFKQRAAFPLYLGGGIGVITVISNNIAYGIISISAIMALILLGQSILGLAVDQFGLMGMPKHPFKSSKLIGLVFIIAGIVVMIDTFNLLAVVVSIAAGFCIIVSRTLNAKLAQEANTLTSVYFNNLVGLIVSVSAFLLLGRAELAQTTTFDPNILLYLGGIMGIGVVLSCNVAVIKVPAFYLTLLMFIGQVSAAVIFDQVLAGSFNPMLLAGGLLVSCGLGINLILDNRKGNPKQHKA